MSRIGRLPVTVPDGVEVTVDGQLVTVLGPRGSLEHRVAEPIKVARGENGEVQVTRPDDERVSKSLHGLTRTLVANMVTGVTTGYEKKTRDRRRRLPSHFQGPNGARVRARIQPPGESDRAGGHHVQRRGADQVFGSGHRQAAGRRGGSEHP